MIIASYAALALALQIMENLLLPPQIVWLRLGVANIVTLVVLYKYGMKTAVQIVFVRVIVASLLLGTFLSPPFWLSFGGGLASVLVMGVVLLSPIRRVIGVVGISIVGAATHNVVQLAIVGVFLGLSLSIISYWAPVIAATAIVFGAITGYVAYGAMK